MCDSSDRDHTELIECECCYEENAQSQITRCKNADPHTFCLSCVKSFMENEIGMMKSDLHCISQGVCNEKFSDGEIKRVLGPLGYKMYERLVQDQCIKKALENGDLDGYEECPHVSYLFYNLVLVWCIIRVKQ
jgi:hypothetical protein